MEKQRAERKGNESAQLRRDCSLTMYPLARAPLCRSLGGCSLPSLFGGCERPPFSFVSQPLKRCPRNLLDNIMFPVPDCLPPCLNDTNVILAALTMETHLAPECSHTMQGGVVYRLLSEVRCRKKLRPSIRRVSFPAALLPNEDIISCLIGLSLSFSQPFSGQCCSSSVPPK